MYRTKSDEIKANIIKLVEERDAKGGISKNEAATLLIARHGGSRATYWKCFNELLTEGQIGLRLVAKQQKRLFTTSKNRKINEFKEKIHHVENLLKLLDKDPVIGDCFSWQVTDQIKINNYYMDQVELYKHVIGYTNDFERSEDGPNAFCLQARYDIIKNLPSFLVNYINDPPNDYSNSVKEECMKFIYPLMIRCLQRLQHDYTNSSYYSNQFYDNNKNNTRISLVRGLPLPDQQGEFLRIVGRYYFLVSQNYSKNGEIDSCEEQMVISRFVENFFSQSKIPNDKMSESITADLITEYWTNRQKPRRKFYKPGMIERLDKVHWELGGKFAKKFDRYANNDPFVVANYYNEWIFSLGLFSLLEKRVIQTYLDEAEKYEKDGKTSDNEDPLEALDHSELRDFRGHLYKRSDGKAIINLNLRYDEVRPHRGRRITVLIE